MHGLGGGDNPYGETAAPGDYPHDRVVFFSDAVFAIAMTLLAIEIRPPSHALIERIGAEQAWNQMMPLFIAYIISFMVLALYWTGHMEAWRMARHATRKLVWINVVQLLCVALVPFGTALYSESYLHTGAGPFQGYCLILAAIAFCSWWLRRAITAQEDLQLRLGRAQARWFEWRALIPMLVFVAAIPLANVLPNWALGWMFVLIWPLSVVGRRLAQRQDASAA